MWYISTTLFYIVKTKNSDFFYKKESDKNSDFFFFLKKPLSVERVYLYKRNCTDYGVDCKRLLTSFAVSASS
nr:MAG TPA: hypothetical protein [Caudoviricetes sp.]